MEDAQLRKLIIEELSKQPTMVLSTALVYAKHMADYGISVVDQWLTAVQQSAAMEAAQRAGYEKAMEKIKERCNFCVYRIHDQKMANDLGQAYDNQLGRKKTGG